jgi:hypothetical protein
MIPATQMPLDGMAAHCERRLGASRTLLGVCVAYEDKGEQGYDAVMAQGQHEWFNTKT